MGKGRVLVVDDLPDVRATLSGLLSDEGYEVRSASSKVEALQLVDAERFHVAVLDVRLDETDEDNQDGILLMHEISEKYPAIAIIILTGYADIKMVREALQPNAEGRSPAFGFLEKSELDQLPEYVHRASEQTRINARETITDLIARGENNQIEFKSSLRWDCERGRVNKILQVVIVKTISGMMNSKGGILLIGVADEGTILGIEKDLQTLHKQNVDGFQLALTSIVKSHLGIEHAPYIDTEFELVEEKYICAVHIQKSPNPVFLLKNNGNEFWVRMGNSTHQLDVKAATSYIHTHWSEND